MAEEREKWELPDDLPYEDWVNHIFDHPVLEPKWHWQDEDSGYYQCWNEEAADQALVLSYITRLFREAGQLRGRFTRGQIDQGINFLINTSSSSHMFVLRNSDLPWPDRRDCIAAMGSLYKDLIAPVYGDDTFERAGRDPERPTFGVSMLWDSIPLYAGLDHPEIDQINDAVLSMFEEVLKLAAESCLDSVLFGLKEWSYFVPGLTKPMVQRFLERRDISPEMRDYGEKVVAFAESVWNRISTS